MQSRYIRILNSIIELKELEDGRKVAIHLNTGKEEEWGFDENNKFYLKEYHEKEKISVITTFSDKANNLETRENLIKWIFKEHHRQLIGDYPDYNKVDAMYESYLTDKIYIKPYGVIGECKDCISFNEIYFIGDLGEGTFIKTRYIDFESTSSLSDIILQAKSIGLKNFQKITDSEFVNLNYVKLLSDNSISFIELNTALGIDRKYLGAIKRKLNEMMK